jgi:hypothetical protein
LVANGRSCLKERTSVIVLGARQPTGPLAETVGILLLVLIVPDAGPSGLTTTAYDEPKLCMPITTEAAPLGVSFVFAFAQLDAFLGRGR